MPKEISLDTEEFFEFPVASNILGEAVPLGELSRDDADVRLFSTPLSTISIGSSLHPAVSMQRAHEDEGVSLVEALEGCVSKKNIDILIRRFVHRQSLRSIAKAQGVKVQAISKRLMRLRQQFPQLDKLWCGAHTGWVRVRPVRR